MIHSLSKPYATRYGVPLLDRVDSEIFLATFDSACTTASCRDSCCSYGVDVDLLCRARILEHARGIEAFCGVDPAQAFTAPTVDPEFPGGAFVRTRASSGHCIFLNTRPGERGCFLHSYSLREGLDYHLLKPMVSCFCPVTFDNGLLHAMDEVADRSLFCLNQGTTLYRGTRSELLYYFGDELIAELDHLESLVGSGTTPKA